MTAVSFSRVARRFGDVRAVDDVSFDVAEGEFFALLGPSGSGKTTCLRLIAGFERPDAGDVLIDGARVNDVPPYGRPVNTVFQDYALFPHLSVADNVAYSLMLRRVPRAERRRQADGMLEMVKLHGLGDRKPGQLSGGQRQRVAVARALINRPKILLLDEPLGALDLKLREAMQIELKTLQRQLGITFVFVTHDQGEALSMADRIAVFNSGRIEQIGASREVYDRPATAFVADFVGGSNVLVGAAAERITGRTSPVSIRPERVLLLAPGSTAPDAVLVDGEVEGVFFLGGTTRASVRTDGGDALAVAAPSHDASGAQLAASLGHRVRLALPHADFWPVRA